MQKKTSTRCPTRSPTWRFSPSRRLEAPVAYPLLLVGVLQAEVVGERPHGYGQLPDLLQLDGPLVGADDQGVHPPVGGLGEQVDEGLEEAHPQVLQVLRGLHLLRVGEEDVLLRGKRVGRAAVREGTTGRPRRTWRDPSAPAILRLWGGI